jgi:hypothetical protein
MFCRAGGGSGGGRTVDGRRHLAVVVDVGLSVARCLPSLSLSQPPVCQGQPQGPGSWWAGGSLRWIAGREVPLVSLLPWLLPFPLP